MPDSYIGLLMVAMRGESRFMGTSMKLLNSIQGEVRSPRSRNIEGGRGSGGSRTSLQVSGVSAPVLMQCAPLLPPLPHGLMFCMLPSSNSRKNLSHLSPFISL